MSDIIYLKNDTASSELKIALYKAVLDETKKQGCKNEEERVAYEVIINALEDAIKYRSAIKEF